MQTYRGCKANLIKVYGQVQRQRHQQGPGVRDQLLVRRKYVQHHAGEQQKGQQYDYPPVLRNTEQKSSQELEKSETLEGDAEEAGYRGKGNAGKIQEVKTEGGIKDQANQVEIELKAGVYQEYSA